MNKYKALFFDASIIPISSITRIDFKIDEDKREYVVIRTIHSNVYHSSNEVPVSMKHADFVKYYKEQCGLL